MKKKMSWVVSGMLMLSFVFTNSFVSLLAHGW